MVFSGLSTGQSTQRQGGRANSPVESGGQVPWPNGPAILGEIEVVAELNA